MNLKFFPALAPIILIMIQAVVSSPMSARAADTEDTSKASEFYVDPDFSGDADGSATRPWTRLQSGQWAIINNELAHGNVTVYFSAREADSDSDDISPDGFVVARTDTSRNRLTLDGMSRYNTSDALPAWKDYQGRSRFCIRDRYPIGAGHVKRNDVTLRGFRLVATTGQGIAYWGGDRIVIEHCEVTADNPSHGPGIIFGYAAHRGGKPGNGGCKSISIRNNTVHGVFGEGIYVGGVEGQNLPAHDGVTIEGNTVYDVAVCGGEGDAIDIKDGNRNVVVRGNRLYMSEPMKGRDGIVVGGAALVEGNFVYNFGRAGISMGTYWNAFPNRSGAVVQNNVIVHCGGNRRYTWDYGIIVGGSKSGDQFVDTTIRHNTIASIQTDRPGGGIGLVVNQYARNTQLQNNLFYDCAGAALSIGEHSLGNHAHNLYYARGESKTLIQRGRDRFTAKDLGQFEPTSLSGDPLLVDVGRMTSAVNLALKPGSPAIDAGIAVPELTWDFRGAKRPQGAGWDIGAFEQQE